MDELYDNRHYSTFDVCKILNIKRSSLNQWIDRGFIVPSINESNGRGDKNLFNYEDLIKIKIFQQLSSIGFYQKKASEIAILIVNMGDRQYFSDNINDFTRIIYFPPSSLEIEININKIHIETEEKVDEFWDKECYEEYDLKDCNDVG